MPREFAITTTSAAVSLDAKGRGEVVFTVTNVTATHMRAKATPQLPPELQPEWVSLRGERSREMPPGSTETFILDIAVPPGTPPGTHTLRLVVADVALPDEHFAESPAVSVNVLAPAAPAPKPFPWWLVVLGAVVIIGGAVAAFLLLRDDEPPTDDTQPPELVCPPGQTRCGEQCVDVNTDEQHCGACDTSCEEDFECREGRCVRTGCPSDQTLCDGRCVDTRSDRQHCGACGLSCASHLTCRNARCECPVATQRNCGNRCVDTATDAQNCGACGNKCASGQTCQNGVCRCNTGLTLCGGQCVNTNTDEQNCGGCGKKCASNATCSNGKCVVPSPCPITGQVLCPCTGTCLSPSLCAKRCEQDVQPF